MSTRPTRPRPRGRGEPRAIRGASEQVAIQIQHYIQEEGLQPDDFLGREEDLASEFGVSRPTLREALKLLASGNLIRASKGPGGGIFVARTADQGMSRSLSDAIEMMLETGAVTLEELVDARLLLEVPLAGLAAYQPDEATLTRLREAVAAELADAGDSETLAATDMEIHRTIAAAGSNRMVQALTDWIFEVRAALADRGAPARDRALGHPRAAPVAPRRDREGRPGARRARDEGPPAVPPRRAPHGAGRRGPAGVSAAPTFALLGLGEAGTAIAADLVAAGATVRGWDPVREAPDGVVPARDELDAVSEAEIVLSLNSAAVAVDAAAAAAPGLDADAVYADLNTAAPAVKRAAAEASGAAFADVALLGPVPGNGVHTPALASGPGAERFAAALEPLGMPVTGLGPEVGAASARKLARSVFAKGLAAAVGESLEAARRLGCEDWLHAELEAALTKADARYLDPADRRQPRSLRPPCGRDGGGGGAARGAGRRAARGRGERGVAALARAQRGGPVSAPEPSAAARELVRGAMDVHVHIAPDVVERRIDDVSLARRFEELGLAGFVLKSHYTSTAERAAVVRGVVPGIHVLGAIVLNRAVGGINPLAVELAAREGARTVWMPTVDSPNEREHLAAAGPGANLPVWAKLEAELRGEGITVDPSRCSTTTAPCSPRCAPCSR